MIDQPRREMAMTDLEKIEYLGEALNNLMQSADTYIVDGSWIDELTLDIENARNLLKKIPPNSWNVEAQND
jgi:hypothetical protein